MIPTVVANAAKKATGSPGLSCGRLCRKGIPHEALGSQTPPKQRDQGRRVVKAPGRELSSPLSRV